MSRVAQIRFEDFARSIPRALDKIQADRRLPRRGLIILKPNLVNADPPPVTTPVDAVHAVWAYCRKYTAAEIAIGDGCGSGATAKAFAANGYRELAQKYGIRLIDFNQEPSVTLRRTDTLQLREFHLPRIAQDAFIISMPVLKDHSMTQTTIALKNMFGLAPAPYYQGAWNKSRLHGPSTHKSIVDICLYKRPDLSVVDASVALTGMHLSGTPREVGLILASFDPVAVDAVGSRLLGHDPTRIDYLRLAQGRLGDMHHVEIVTDGHDVPLARSL